MPVTTRVSTYSLEQTASALEDLRHGKFDGAAVILLGKPYRRAELVAKVRQVLDYGHAGT